MQSSVDDIVTKHCGGSLVCERSPFTCIKVPSSNACMVWLVYTPNRISNNQIIRTQNENRFSTIGCFGVLTLGHYLHVILTACGEMLYKFTLENRLLAIFRCRLDRICPKWCETLARWSYNAHSPPIIFETIKVIGSNKKKSLKSASTS